jgi:2-succinyl-6-hydroxy-2,4-cyclohexadiene-1-carboxylate synthase
MRLTINGIEYHLEQGGHGPPLLLLHGFAGSAADWLGVRNMLEAQYTVIAPDLIGHGRSAAPPDSQRYAMEQCVADLISLLDALQIAQTDLLGYSMGGRIALHLAYAAPKRIGRLVIESASPGLADPDERAARIAADEALATRIEREGIARFVEDWEQLPLFASQARLPQAVRAAQRARRLQQRPQGLANALRGMGTGIQRSLWDDLEQIHQPTLVLTGALDAKFCAIGREMAERLPHAQHRIVSDAGHNLHLEQPQVFAGFVMR